MIRIYHSADSFLKSRQVFPDYLNQVSDTVREIIQTVRKEGDVALREYTARFDGQRLSHFRIESTEIDSAVKHLNAETKAIILEAAENIRQFHQKQYPQSWLDQSPDGTQLGQKFTPIESVGVYVPGGTAAYPSSVLMNVIPAQIAQVPRIVAISPPTSGGKIHSTVLATLGLLGIDEIYSIGGAQGIAALAYGTESIPRVYKITGPGNAYVMEAKRQVYGQVGIDSLAGPTELVVIADEVADPIYIARDLMAQAEHDIHAMTVLVTPSLVLATAVAENLEKFTQEAQRKEILTQALQNYGAAVIVKTLSEAVSLANEIAPEHLEIMTLTPESLVEKVHNAGAIFWGKYSSEAVGDYWAGPNHILPTNGNAKFASPLGVLDFMKYSSLIAFSEKRLVQDAPKIEKFAELEGLFNHQKSIEVRHA